MGLFTNYKQVTAKAKQTYLHFDDLAFEVIEEDNNIICIRRRICTIMAGDKSKTENTNHNPPNTVSAQTMTAILPIIFIIEKLSKTNSS